MNKYVIGAIALVVLAGGMITAMTQARNRVAPDQVPQIAATATLAATPALPGDLTADPARPRAVQDNPAAVEAHVVPISATELHFTTSGTVAEVLVREGATVNKGDIIARLDSRDLDLDIKVAEAELAAAQADYELLAAGPEPSKINEAQARLTRAKAVLSQTQALVTDKDIAAAQEQLAALKTKLQALQAKPSVQQIAVAKANLEDAKLHLQSDRDTLSAHKTTLQARLEQAANVLRDAQDVYRRIKQANDAGKPTQDEQDAEARALRAMQNAEQDYKIAQVELDEAQKVEKVALAASEGKVAVAQAEYEAALASQPADEIAQTRADIAKAEADLNRLRDDYRAAQIGVSQSEVGIAEAELETAKATPRPVDLASASARVKQAELLLQQRKFAMERLLLRAPASGQVARLDLRAGQVIQDQVPAGLLADTSGWQIQADELSELAVVGVKEGDPVVITFYAIPGLEVKGTVSHIRPIGEAVRNDVTTYTLVVTPDQSDPRLRWNMSATVRILPKQ